MNSASPEARERAAAYKTARYNGQKIKYTHDHVVYNNLHIPIRVRRMEAGRRIYIETDDRKVFETRDMLSFKFIGPGSLLGTVDDYVICRDTEIYIYNGERRLHLQFKLENELLYYAAGASRGVKGQGGADGKSMASVWDNTENTVNNVCAGDTQPAHAGVTVGQAVVYKRYLVVCKSRNVLFVSFDDEVDTQCRLSCSIDGVRRRKIDGVPFLRVEHGGRASYYYHNRLVCSDVLPGAKLRERLGLGKIERLVFRHLGCADRISLIKKETTTGLERGAADALDRELHASPDFESFVSLCRGCVQHDGTQVPAPPYREYFRRLKQLAATEWFYERPDSFLDFYRHAVVDVADPAFLARVYRRVFFYDRGTRGTRRPAYKVISEELRSARGLGGVHDSPSTEIGGFRRIHGDLRVKEITDIMVESSITIEANADDTDAIRQKAFLVRLLAGAGTFLLNSAGAPYQADLAVQINGRGVEEMVSEDLVFLSGVYYGTVAKETSPVWTGARKTAVFGMGRDFGLAFAGRLEDEKHQAYLGRLRDADEKSGYLGYTLLILASHQKRARVGGQPSLALCDQNGRAGDATDRIVYNSRINQILASQIGSSSLGLKKMAIASLAIYNAGSGDTNLFGLLSRECRRFGSTDSEKNTQFYDRRYRALAAVAASLVHSVRSSIQLNDSFCELIINGFSFLGLGVYKNRLQRYDDCRHDEIFYSELFMLVNGFETPIGRVVDELDGFLARRGAADIHRAAARVFYISLKHLHGRPCGPGACADEPAGYARSLFSFVEKAEDRLVQSRRWQVLFDFALISLSVILNSTFDLNLLRILRRQVLMSREIADTAGTPVFDQRIKNTARFYGSGYESMLYYKLCIGMVCCGFGTRRLRIACQHDYKALIVAFFYAGNSLPSFEPADLLRLLVLRSTERNTDFGSVWAASEEKRRLKRRRRRLMRSFIKRFEGMAGVDKKFTVDVLSDFYENHFPEGGTPLFDLRFLAKVLSIVR